MKFVKHCLAGSLAFALVTLAGPSWADWAESTDPSVVRPAPTNLQVQPQNPPAFAWAKYPGKVPATSYTLEISKDGAVYTTFTSARNFYLPSKQLPVGNYSWRVRSNVSADWSAPRGFIINSTSAVFEVPEDAAVRSTVQAKPHPRMLPADFKPVSAWTAEMRTARTAMVTKLTTDVNTQVTSFTLAADALWPVTATTPSAARQAYIADITRLIGQNTRQLESAALLWRLTGEAKFLTEALRRGDALAALDPNGMTSYVNHDQGTRTIMLALAKGVDMLGTSLDATRKTKWLASLSARVAPMYADLISNNYRLDEQPYDSHAQVAQGYLAVISALTLGDLPAAQTWFDFSFRFYVNSIYVWSGPEGGYGNGSGYAMYSTDYAMQLWQSLHAATGVNLFRKPWSAGFANFIAQFIPPGAPGLVFGDMHEDYLYLPQLKAFMSRFATPTAAWYVKNLTGTETPLTLLQAPYPLPVDTVSTVTAPANAAVFPSIGWVSMHSSIADRARTSVFFKSSPFGSYNHSHGDQNSIVVDSGGRRLLIEAGYQDYYYSPLGTSWYRQTKSHNGITYNGGVGQITTEGYGNLARNGKITAFSTTAAIDYAEGDATPAYGAPITNATRKVWYLRNEDAVVVLDKLASSSALTFEWNMHAAVPFVKESASKIKVTNVDRSLCINSLSTDGTAFQARTGPAPAAGKVEDHGAFVKSAAATSGEFLVVLDVNCRRPAISLGRATTGRTLKVGNTSIVLPN